MNALDLSRLLGLDGLDGEDLSNEEVALFISLCTRQRAGIVRKLAAIADRAQGREGAPSFFLLESLAESYIDAANKLGAYIQATKVVNAKNDIIGHIAKEMSK